MSDKPWIAVDEWDGVGQHDVYVVCCTRSPSVLWLTVSTNGAADWSIPTAIRQFGISDVMRVQSGIPLVGPDHNVYLFWIERNGTFQVGTNWIKMCQIRDHGTVVGNVKTVCRVVSTNYQDGNLELRRNNMATNTDIFKVLPFPVPAVNPSTNLPGNLYVAYADRGTNNQDRADVFFVRSADAGTNWTAPVRVNTDSTFNDQWMPVLAVKPDGTQLFIAWYDRRNDPNNGWIEIYGCFGTIATNGDVVLGSEFKISTTSFPMVFAGTDTNSLVRGNYDPVYPPEGVNLHWNYPEWPTNNLIVTAVSYAPHVGEYNGVCAQDQYVYFTWTDYRLPASCGLSSRNQSDIRLVRLAWPP